MNISLLHGGNLNAAAERYGIPIEDWLDLSTGINPNPYPIPDIPGRAWARLPEAQAEAGLIDAARACYGASNADIVAAPGTQALIQLLAALRPSGRVCVFGPTYGEHAHAWRRAGHRIDEHTIGESWPETADVIVVVNPNNPDGHLYVADDLRDAADRLAARGGWLVVDEAFADVTPGNSLAAETGIDGLIVLRSFGKFFGLAGLRLGFVLTNTDIADLLRDRLGPWCVPGPALEVGRRALEDEVWIDQTRATLQTYRTRFDQIIRKSGVENVGGTDLFVLVRAEDELLHDNLARQGIWTRVFDDRPGLVRFGMPGYDEAFRRLNAALKIADTIPAS